MASSPFLAKKPAQAAQMIDRVALVVRDYDEAIAFYVDRLGFELIEDTQQGAGKR